MALAEPKSTHDRRHPMCSRSKPMMMLRFNYKSLEQGFESISVRCAYCKAEDTPAVARA
jgi:hypothetical protein